MRGASAKGTQKQGKESQIRSSLGENLPGLRHSMVFFGNCNKQITKTLVKLKKKEEDFLFAEGILTTARTGLKQKSLSETITTIEGY